MRLCEEVAGVSLRLHESDEAPSDDAVSGRDGLAA